MHEHATHGPPNKVPYTFTSMKKCKNSRPDSQTDIVDNDNAGNKFKGSQPMKVTEWPDYTQLKMYLSKLQFISSLL